MMRVIAAVLLLSCTWPMVAGAQSLAEVARQEEARRKVVKPSRRVYTNADLKSDGSTAAPVAPATPVSHAAPTAPTTASGEKPANADGQEPRDQAYWSGRMSTARAALERSRIFAEALQSRINALTTDFVNRDDPAQRAQLELERQRSVAELDRVKREMGEQTKAIAAIEEEARKAGVPPGWLR
jgi:hypothetical protein